jgi:hypothetical protein
MERNLREANLAEAVEWRKIEEAWKHFLPYLKKAAIRLHVNPLTSGVLKNYSAEFLKEIFGPPVSIIDERKQFFAGQIFAWLFPEKEIEFIVTKATPEVEEVYHTVVKEGSGWGSFPKSTPEKRKMAVLNWWGHNQGRLFYLKETHLGDTKLYEFGGGQERRGFIGLLLKKIVEDQTNMNVTRQKVYNYYKRLKKKPLRLKKLQNQK